MGRMFEARKGAVFEDHRYPHRVLKQWHNFSGEWISKTLKDADLWPLALAVFLFLKTAENYKSQWITQNHVSFSNELTGVICVN